MSTSAVPRMPASDHNTHLLGQLDIVLLIGLVAGRQQVADEEDEENQLDSRADRVVLVAGAHIADDDGRSRHLLKGDGRLMEPVRDMRLYLV